MGTNGLHNFIDGIIDLNICLTEYIKSNSSIITDFRVPMDVNSGKVIMFNDLVNYIMKSPIIYHFWTDSISQSN